MEKMDAHALLASTLQLDKVCRTCLTERGDMKPLFGACLDEMLGAIAQLEIKENDGLPSQMCMQCMRLCNRAYTFKKQCEKSDSILRDYIALKSQNQLCDAQEMISVDNALQQFSNAVTNVVIEELPADLIPYESNGIKYYTTENVLVEPIKTLQDGNYEVYIQSDLTSKKEIEHVYACPKCNDTFKLKVDLEVHMMSHPKDMVQHVCAVCYQSFSNAHSLQDHAKTHVAKKAHQCDKCEMSFDKSWNLTRHMNKHSQVRPFFCPVCKRAFKCAAYVEKHMKQNQECKRSLAEAKGSKKVAKVVNFHQCDQCNMSFAKIWNLNRHKMLHKQDRGRPHVCSVCDRTFESTAALSGHMRCHPDKRVHACEFCNKQYMQKRSLKAHLRSHTGETPPTDTGEKNHVCEACGKAFSGSNSLALHKRIHIKRRECPICKKKFTQQRFFDIHIQQEHAVAGDKTLACKVCGKVFASASLLSGHMWTHAKQLECDICFKPFTRTKNLNQHKRMHVKNAAMEAIETVKSVPCQACDALFDSDEAIQEHMLTIHQLKLEQVENVGISGLLIDPTSNTIRLATISP